MNEYTWWRWLCGWVRFETEGDSAGRLLTLAARDGIALWDTRRTADGFSACCRANAYPRLRPIARRCGRRLRVRERHGAAFVFRRYHKRIGVPVAIGVYVVLLVWLSSRIWSLDIRGLQYADEAALRALLAEHGVSVGAPKRGVDSEAVRLDALTRLEDVSWLAVNLDGCVAQVELKEMNPHETPTEPTAPSNLVAARDGVVVAVEITSGAAAVQVGDAVAAGNILASGIVTTEQGVTLHRSSGRVLAKTVREIAVEIPLTEECLLPCRKPFEALTLSVFGLHIPLYDDRLSGDGCRVETHESTLTVGGIPLPLGIRIDRYTPLSVQTVIRTVEEATRLAETALAENEAALLADAEVHERTVTAQTSENAVRLTAVYSCTEDIASEVPLRLG
ncbi:MAG: hypothetical protein E7549_01340 [Ruminococcaceae bacterium]|nr:hypothetical protein [Oscillospiraceae bacterium]